MSLYLDTSVVVKAVTAEQDYQSVQAWLAEQAQGTLFISDWSVTELHSALALKRRTGQINDIERALALSAFAMLCDESFAISPIPVSMFRVAATLIDRAANLRAGDALHLAIARHHGLTLVSLDQALLRVAINLGTSAVSPLP